MRLISRFFYQRVAKPIFFRFDAEKTHTQVTQFGEQLGKIRVATTISKLLFGKQHPSLSQKIAGTTFPSPIGLSAGFDYEGKLTQILPALGFGFQTIGTITNFPYNGNSPPILNRIPDRKSLLVNKGFKNLGADETIKRLKGKEFKIPVGISIGKTNHKGIDTQEKSIKDIVTAFKKFETANLPTSYYELNISCPNLTGSVTFYPPRNLTKLLMAVDSLKLKKPLFVKMPISETNEDTLKMVSAITTHSPSGIIIGNLHKELGMRGGLSGKPTFQRSNELISLVHSQHPALTIIGCGGIFSATDAKEKLDRGASLIQLITGLVFEGPQLVSEINNDLVKLKNHANN